MGVRLYIAVMFDMHSKKIKNIKYEVVKMGSIVKAYQDL